MVRGCRPATAQYQKGETWITPCTAPRKPNVNGDRGLPGWRLHVAGYRTGELASPHGSIAAVSTGVVLEYLSALPKPLGLFRR